MQLTPVIVILPCGLVSRPISALLHIFIQFLITITLSESSDLKAVIAHHVSQC